MALLTGTSGELRYAGLRVAKCRNFSIDISKDALETTVLGTYDRTYIEGLRGATGSATVLYDRDDAGTSAIISSIFINKVGDQTLSLILDTSDNRCLECRAFLTQVSVPVSVGEVTACNISFQVTGPFEETI